MLYRLALARLKGMSVPAARQILTTLGSEKEFFELPATRLADLWQGFDRNFTDTLRAEALRQAETEAEFIEKNGIRVLWFNDPASGYPSRLLECPDAPPLLFSLGHADLNNPHVLSVVGTRHATAYGQTFTADTIAALKPANPLIVSGLAYGIDVAAHKAALANNLPTAAVVAHGLATIYPAAHRQVAARIVEQGGVIVTEYFSSDPVHRGNFLARNRIVAAMADGVLVVESDAQGGALSTARAARRYGRHVFAVPGRITDRFSRGCNAMIAEGNATCALDARSIAAPLGWQLSQASTQLTLFDNPLSPAETAVVAFITANGTASAADIHDAFPAMPLREIMALLVDLEFRGHLDAMPGARYSARS